MNYEPVIGLEIHAQLKTDSKIFCGCSTRFGEAPNASTCPVCLGLPGVLPVLNKRVVEFAIRAALATSCRINPESDFARKNYFYPDLPKGYQISQYAAPIAEEGHVEIDVNGTTRRIGLIRIHMEEDAGKLIHDDYTPSSFVDLNRTGVPLIEIVSQPDMRSAEEAAAYLRHLHEILVYLDICDGNMEEGSFRCDANVSLRPVGTEPFGTRTELKNMNSFRNVQRAIEYEIKRQTYVLDEGSKIVQETRLWDDGQGVTNPMRGKEEAHDYRYFPDPDLVTIAVDEAWIAAVRATLPELPRPKRERFMAEFGLPAYDAGVLTADPRLADYFEETARLSGQPKAASNWVMGDLLKFLNEEKRSIADCRIPPAHLAAMIRRIEDGAISGKQAKDVLEEMYRTGKDPDAVIQEKGLVQISDEASLCPILEDILAKNAGQVEQYRSGKEKVFGFFVGQAMKATSGKANPALLNDLLKRLLQG